MRRKRAEGGGLPEGRRVSKPASWVRQAAIAAIRPALLAQLGLAALMDLMSALSSAISSFKSAIIKTKSNMTDKLFMASQV